MSPINFRYHLSLADGSLPFNFENTDKDEVLHARRLFAREIDLQVFREALETFVELSKRHAFVPIVIYIPSTYTAYAKNVLFSDPDLHTLMPWFSHEQRTFFERQGKELKYLFVDLTSPFQSAASSSDSQNLFYHRRNLHLTYLGHKVVAETLSEMVRSLDPVKGRLDKDGLAKTPVVKPKKNHFFPVISPSLEATFELRRDQLPDAPKSTRRDRGFLDPIDF